LHPVTSSTPSGGRGAPASTCSAASRSSRIRICGATSSSVTAAPKRWNTCASSHPIGPAPITAIRLGQLGQRKDCLVGKVARLGEALVSAARPRGAPGCDRRSLEAKFFPVHFDAVGARQNVPSPINTSTPRPRNLSAESIGLKSARSLRIRSITAGKLTPRAPAVLRPRISDAPATSAAGLARTEISGLGRDANRSSDNRRP